MRSLQYKDSFLTACSYFKTGDIIQCADAFRYYLNQNNHMATVTASEVTLFKVIMGLSSRSEAIKRYTDMTSQLGWYFQESQEISHAIYCYQLSLTFRNILNTHLKLNTLYKEKTRSTQEFAYLSKAVYHLEVASQFDPLTYDMQVYIYIELGSHYLKLFQYSEKRDCLNLLLDSSIKYLEKAQYIFNSTTIKDNHLIKAWQFHYIYGAALLKKYLITGHKECLNNAINWISTALLLNPRASIAYKTLITIYEKYWPNPWLRNKWVFKSILANQFHKIAPSLDFMRQ